MSEGEIVARLSLVEREIEKLRNMKVDIIKDLSVLTQERDRLWRQLSHKARTKE